MKKAFLFIIIIFSFCPNIRAEVENVNIHGFISQGYLLTTENDYFYSETKDGTFQFNEMGLNFGTNVTEDLRLAIQFLAKDLGVLGNDEVTVDYAIADYSYRNWLGLRVGKMKRPNGIYNQSRDIDAGRLCIFLPQSIYHEVYRDQMLALKGLSLYGLVLGQLNYQLAYGIFDLPFDSGLSKVMKDLVGLSPIGYDMDPISVAYVLWNTPFQGLNLGATFTSFKWAVNITESTAIDFSGYQVIGSIEYTYDNFLFSAEFARNPTDIEAPGYTYLQEGEFYYALASYRLFDWFEFGGGYSAMYIDIEKRKDPTQYLKDFFLSLRFDINDYWILKLEGHKMDSLSSIQNEDPSEDWYMFAAKLTFSF